MARRVAAPCCRQAETSRTHRRATRASTTCTDIYGDDDGGAARTHMLVRDHDREKFEARKTFVENAVRYLNGLWGEDCFRLELKDSVL